MMRRESGFEIWKWVQALIKRAKANHQAQLGQYDPSSESSDAGERTYEKGYVY